MTCSKANYINLFVLAAVLFVSSEKVPKYPSYKKVLGQVANSLAVAQIRNVSSKTHFEVCADEGEEIFYCPLDEICCAPGDPASRCCPAEYPLCLPRENPEKCCPVGYPTLCGRGCCKEGTFCCNGMNCCDSVGACCGAQSCEFDEFCCNGISCCDSADACCGTQCCPEDASCCKQGGSSACCDKVTMGCCDGSGCVHPCPSQFDALGCQLSSLFLDNNHLETLYTSTKNVYRILRPDENPEGIVAKDPVAEKSVLSHVNRGSWSNYASQFISTSASLDVAKDYKEKGGEPRQVPGKRSEQNLCQGIGRDSSPM